MRRLLHYVRLLAANRWMWLSSPLNTRNLRALWIQSDPDWLSKLDPIEMSDEEWAEFQEAMR